MALHGQNFVGYSLSAAGDKVINAENPITGTTLETNFIEATEAEINKSCELAKQAFDIYRNKKGRKICGLKIIVKYCYLASYPALGVPSSFRLRVVHSKPLVKTF